MTFDDDRDYKLLPYRVTVVAWSLVALWLPRSQAMIFNDDRACNLHIMVEIGIYY
jgi:hypothetical protein